MQATWKPNEAGKFQASAASAEIDHAELRSVVLPPPEADAGKTEAQ
jgi:hypothetical protein